MVETMKRLMAMASLVLAATVLFIAVAGCGPSKFNFEIKSGKLLTLRKKYLAVMMELTGTVRGISSVDHVNVSIMLHPRSGNPFEHTSKDVEGLNLDTITIHGAGSLKPKDYLKFSVKIDHEGKLIDQKYFTIDENGTSSMAEKSDFEEHS